MSIEEETEIIMDISSKLNDKEIQYWEELVFRYKELQERIDKAIEYINKVKYKGCDDGNMLTRSEIEIALDILQGDDKE